MNIDEKLEAKIKSLDEKIKNHPKVNVLKLQQCMETRHMGMPIGNPHKVDSGDDGLNAAHIMISKIMTLHFMNALEESLEAE